MAVKNQFPFKHLSKGKSGLREIWKQFLPPFSGTVFHDTSLFLDTFSASRPSGFAETLSFWLELLSFFTQLSFLPFGFEKSNNFVNFVSKCDFCTTNNRHVAHWIYQNSMLMSWPETTEHTNVLLMTQGFRNYLSFCSRPQKKHYLYGAHYIACKWQFHWSKKKILGSGTKRKGISESLGHKKNVGVLRCFGSWH